MNAESIPQRVDRIMREHNVGFSEAMRVAQAESRIEREVARRKGATP